MHALLLVAALLGADPVSAATAYSEESYKAPGSESGEVIKYRLLKPAKIEPGKKFPVVLFLHGAGERGDNNLAQLKYFPTRMLQDDYREKYPAFVIAPQCPNGKKWSDADWSLKTSSPLPEKISDSAKAALGMLDDVIKNNPVDTNRVYLTGLSMGGYGSWDLASRFPERFAAVAPICGGGDDKQAEVLKNVPIYAYHGDKDTAVPVERTRQMIEAIKKAGGQPKYKELPGVGHNSWDAAYNDADGVVPWMFEQAKKPTDSAKQ